MNTPMITAPGGEARVQLGATVHLDVDTALSAHVHPDENRVVVGLGQWPTGAARCDLFAHRAALVRLRDFLNDTVTALDTATGATTTAITSTSTSTERDTAA